nr:uncharacterized protein LOC129421554 [Misgurnus anguillicaudatus]
MLHISTSLMLFGTGFLTVLCPAVSTEVLPGENVVIWCEHNIHVSGKLCWFKQTSYAVPVTIVCMLYTESLRQNVKPRYFANFTMNQMIMDMYPKSTSLTILDVRVSDSGFYFCGVVDYQMKFGNGSRLDVKDKNMSRKNDTETLKNDHNQSSVSADHCSENIFFILTFIFGGFIIFTFNILLILIIIRKHRRLKQRKAAEHQAQQQDCKEQDSESVEYSAVHFSRRERQTNTIVMYEMYTDAT